MNAPAISCLFLQRHKSLLASPLICRAASRHRREHILADALDDRTLGLGGARQAGGLGVEAVSCAHADRRHQAVSNCAFASSRVAAWPSLLSSAGTPNMP